MTDWHLQAFGEWLAYLFPRATVGALCRAERVNSVWFFVLFTKCKCIIGPLALFLVRCAQVCFVYCWIL